MSPDQPAPPRYHCRHVVAGQRAMGVVQTRAFGTPLWSLQLYARLCAECMRELLEVLELELERVDADD